ESSNPQLLADVAIQVAPAAKSTDSNVASGGRSNERQLPTEPAQTGSLEKTIEQLNHAMQAWSTGVRFEMDDDAQRLVVSVVDSQSGEVIRTFPSDAVLRIAKMIIQFQGNTVDTHA